jgi:hypothetical protein
VTLQVLREAEMFSKNQQFTLKKKKNDGIPSKAMDALSDFLNEPVGK